MNARPGRRWWRSGVVGLGLASGVLGGAEPASAQVPVQAATAIRSLDDLVRLTPEQLDALYAAGTAAAIPPGRVKGRAIQYPGTRLAVPASRVTRLVWQGKIIGDSGDTAINRFFGVPAVRADVAMGPSWRDGGASLILDYQDTSRVYRRYRDEIRQVAPGLFLGLMYERTSPEPRLKMYFALDARP